MIPANCPLTLVRGDDWAMTVAVTDGNDDPIDVTDWTYRAQIRKRATDKNVLQVLECYRDQYDSSQIVIRLSSEAAESFTTSSAVWDLELTDTGGIVQTVLIGKVTIILDVTRDLVVV